MAKQEVTIILKQKIGKGDNMENDFVIHTEITIDDFEKIMTLIKKSLKHTDDITEIKSNIELFEKLETLVKQFNNEKEIKT
jgi:hypothetical protein